MSATTQAERDAAYDNSGAVADSAARIAERNAASMRFRTSVPAVLDLHYAGEARTRWDLYPAEQPEAPCLVFLHGGYWQKNSREDFACLATGLRAHGWSVAMPGYTLAPEASLRRIVGEIHEALDWLSAQGSQHGMTGPVVASGWSAGGTLTALCLSHPLVVAGLAVSGIYELGPLRDTWLNDALRLTDAEIADFSPLRTQPVPKPLAIAYGTAELPALVEDSRALHRRRAAIQLPGRLVPVAGADHFSILDGYRAASGELVQAALALLG